MADEPVLAGAVEAFGVAEVVAFLNMAEQTGVLEFRFPDDVVKRLHLDRGEIVFATSTLVEDRLGESLLRAGRISRAQLDIAARAITPGNKLGKILVEMGCLTPRELFGAVRRQIEEIVESLLDFDRGRFVFTTGLPEGGTRVRLSSPTREFVLAAVGRRGAAGSPEPAAPGVGALEALVGRYDRALELIAGTMRARGIDPEACLAEFLAGGQSPRAALFEGVRLGAAGGLPADRLVANARGPAGAAALGESEAAYLEAGLDELFAYSLFSVQDVVDADEAEQLAARLRAIFTQPEAGPEGPTDGGGA